MKPILLLCLLLPAASVLAEQLHRCVGPAPGQVSYQSAACPAGTRRDRSIAYVPEPPPPIRRATAAPQAAGAPRRPAWGTTGAPRKNRVDPCSQAKAWRERELERLGLGRRFDDLSRIDARVRAACKGY